MIREYRGKLPQIAPTAYIDPAATVIGDVTIGERASIWPGVVLRGDADHLEIGEESNIQDNSVVHADWGVPTHIGKRVTAGHMVMLHGCTIGDDALIGIGAIILNHAKIDAGAVIAAGSLVPEGMEIPAGMLAMGSPAKVRREVSEEEKRRFHEGMKHYAEKAAWYREHESR